MRYVLDVTNCCGCTFSVPCSLRRKGSRYYFSSPRWKFDFITHYKASFVLRYIRSQIVSVYDRMPVVFFERYCSL